MSLTLSVAAQDRGRHRRARALLIICISPRFAPCFARVADFIRAPPSSARPCYTPAPSERPRFSSPFCPQQEFRLSPSSSKGYSEA
ncbi:unnamed protein product [Pleuronectes platessa]|uniref:Uncharacterized protein n=1 Tax=Pleuronectes platessa TaxID=8262 RepID=A0A9N7UN49_PLEPL|nr:unnamed protein product [Pleuronectes platessa]